jgi:hypothetical protein
MAAGANERRGGTGTQSQAVRKIRRKRIVVNDILCTGQARSLPELINQCGFSTEAFLLVEKLPQSVVSDGEERQNLLYFAHLRDIRQEDIATYTSYTSGRVFDQERELRWEHDISTGKTNVVYLGKPCILAGLTKDENEPGREPATNKKYYYLFGQILADPEQMGIKVKPELAAYAEVRIPRLLLYPRLGTKPPQRLKLEVHEYVDQETGHVKLFRFRDLQPAE